MGGRNQTPGSDSVHSHETAASILHNTHDKLFKSTFSRHDEAVGFFKNHLPESLVRQLDFNSLQLLSGTFVDDHPLFD